MKNVISFFLLFINISVFAQIKITGTVNKKDNTPIALAEVILVSKDSIAVKSELTENDGSFTILAEQGLYKLEIKEGKTILFTKVIEVNTNLDLGKIIVASVNELENVTIVAKKKLIERKVDRLIFNVENSISAAGGDAFETLKITPGVRVQEDNVAIIGKSNLIVMVDDKVLTLSGEDLTNFLKSIPSDNIKNIEVITNPPSKYEAAGNSGLVNIVLKKAKKNSWNGLIGASYLQRVYSEGATMGSFNYNKDKLSVSASINYKNGGQYIQRDEYVYFPDEILHTNSPIKVKYAALNAKLDIEYQLSSNWKIGGQYMTNNNKPVGTDSPSTIIYNNVTSEAVQSLNSDGRTVRYPGIRSFNFYNEFKLDSLGKKISLNFDYFNYDNEDTRRFGGISVIENPYKKQYFSGINVNNLDITNLSAKLDVDFPTKFAVLNFGGKISNSKANNDILNFNSGLVNNPVTQMPLTQNNFDYTENVQAVYISGVKKINDKWESQLGVRVEATQTESFTLSLNQLVKKDYIKIFPTAYLSYTPNDDSKFNLSYSRRIDRPQYSDLNPNIWYTNIFQTMQGNPFLQPAFIDNAEFTYTYKNLENKFYFSYEDNMYYPISIPDSDGNIIRSTILNYISTSRYGISENYVFDKIKFWTSSNSVDVNYSISKSSLDLTRPEQKGFNSRISTSNDFTLNSSKTILFNVSYWYSFPGIDGVYNNKATNSLSLAIQYLLLNKDLKISLRGNDIFKGEVQRGNLTVNSIYQENRYYFDRQSFQLSLSYKFGNKKIRGIQRETGNGDEKGRTGN
ncbi:outer membrane beta-barrel family protein [Flavobacterium sp. N502540]|uniref:outer membrane beta-barrel family protein n=1 Tax=Flavobacterium sp. N502540 TaxID=2986838 RepID=UPI002225322A|nr:outer membrane beta-barrel family protein [Flavobacterium sp. N502540]